MRSDSIHEHRTRVETMPSRAAPLLHALRAAGVGSLRAAGPPGRGREGKAVVRRRRSASTHWGTTGARARQAPAAVIAAAVAAAKIGAAVTHATITSA